MPAYRAPVADTLFVLNDVLKYERYNNLPGFADATPDIVEAVLQEGGLAIEREHAVAADLGPVALQLELEMGVASS